MDEYFPISHLAHAEGGPVGYETSRVIYVFTGTLFRPTFMMLMRRTALDQDDLRPLIRGMPRRLQVRLVERFGDVPTAGEWSGQALRNRLEKLFLRARIRTFAFDPAERGRLSNPDDVLFEEPETVDGELIPVSGNNDALHLQRLELARELGGILRQRWLSRDASDAAFYQSPAWQQHLIVTGAFFHAAGSAAASVGEDLWEFGGQVTNAAAQLPARVREAVSDLPELGTVVIERSADAVASGWQLAHDLGERLTEATWEDVKHRLTQLGLAVQGGIEQAMALLRRGREALEALLADTATRELLWDFLIGWKESISEFDRRTWLLRGGATVAVVIGAEVIIGLGLALAGAGIAVAAARASRRIGQFTRRAIEVMAEIVQLLRRMGGRRRPDDRRREDPDIGRDGRPVPAAQPGPTPHPGLHNSGMRPDVEDHSFQTQREVDMKNLSAADQRTAANLKAQGWDPDKVEEVLESGTKARVDSLQPGDRVYGFNSHGRHRDLGNSAYLLDEAGFRDVQERFHRDGHWDREGVKNYLALPCYNQAGQIDVLEVIQPTDAVKADIGPATELLQYYDPDSSYATDLMRKTMPGGGTQVTIDQSALKVLKP